MAVRDLKRTVANLGKLLRHQPFNLQIRHTFFKHCKDLKRIVKRKKYLYKKEFYDKLIHWRESAPKQYWQYLNSLRNEDNTNKNMDIPTNFDELVNHFQSQGEPESFNLDFKKELKLMSHLVLIKLKNVLEN